MLKHALFFGKIWKNHCSVGGSAQTPVGLLRLKAPTQTPKLLLSLNFVLGLLLSADTQIYRHR